MPSITKGDIVNNAFSALGMGGSLVSLLPNDHMLALNTLESMVRHWESNDVHIGYNFTEQLRLTEPHNVDRMHWDTMSYSLAIQISPNYDVVPSQELQRQASSAMSATLATLAKVNVQQVNYSGRMPVGAANELRYFHFYRYFPTVEDVRRDYNFYRTLFYPGDINFYDETFSDYLLPNESIIDYTIETERGLQVINSSNVQHIIQFALKSDSNHTGSSQAQVVIEIQTSDGRVDRRVLTYQIMDHVLIPSAALSTGVVPVLPVDVARQLNPNVLVIADVRVPRVPAASPFDSIEARDVWAFTSRGELYNSDRLVTVVYVINDEDNENSYSEYQWNGANQPTTYNSSNWVRILELSRLEVKSIYESHFTQPFGTMEAKSNSQLRAIDGSSGHILGGARSLATFAGIEFFAYGNRGEVISNDPFYSIHYDKANQLLLINNGIISDHLLFSELTIGSVIMIEAVTVTLDQDGFVDSAVNKAGSWVKLVVTADVPGDDVLNISVVEIEAGIASGGIEDRPDLDATVLPLLVLSTDAVLESPHLSQTAQGLQFTRLVTFPELTIESSDAGTLIVFEPDELADYEITMGDSAELPGFGVIIDNRTDQDVVIRPENPQSLLNGEPFLQLQGQEKTRLIGIGEGDTFEGWDAFSFLENDEIRPRYESNFPAPWNTLNRKKNAVFNYLSRDLRLKGDARFELDAEITGSDLDGTFGFSGSGDDVQINIRLTELLFTQAFKLTRAGDLLSIRNTEANEGTVQWVLTQGAVFENGVLTFTGRELYRTGRADILNRVSTLTYQFGVTSELSLSDVTRIAQGIHNVRRVEFLETLISPADVGRILVFDFVSFTNHEVMLPTLTTDDEGFSFAVDSRLTLNLTFKASDYEIVFASEEKGIVYFDGETFQSLKYTDYQGVVTTVMPLTDIEVKEAYERNYQAPFNTLDSKLNNTDVVFNDIEFRYVGDTVVNPAQTVNQTTPQGGYGFALVSGQRVIRIKVLSVSHQLIFRRLGFGAVIRFRDTFLPAKFAEYTIIQDAEIADDVVILTITEQARASNDLEDVHDLTNTPRTDIILHQAVRYTDIPILGTQRQVLEMAVPVGELTRDHIGQMVVFRTETIDDVLSGDQVVQLPLVDNDLDSGAFITVVNERFEQMIVTSQEENRPEGQGLEDLYSSFPLLRFEWGNFVYGRDRWHFEHLGSSFRRRRDSETELSAPYNVLQSKGNALFGGNAQPFTFQDDLNDVSAAGDANFEQPQPADDWRLQLILDLANEEHRDLLRSQVGRYITFGKTGLVYRGWLQILENSGRTRLSNTLIIYNLFIRDAELLEPSSLTFDDGDAVFVIPQVNNQINDFRQAQLADKSNAIYCPEELAYTLVGRVPDTTARNMSINLFSKTDLGGELDARITLSLDFSPSPNLDTLSDGSLARDFFHSRAGRRIRIAKTTLIMTGNLRLDVGLANQSETNVYVFDLDDVVVTRSTPSDEFANGDSVRLTFEDDHRTRSTVIKELPAFHTDPDRVTFDRFTDTGAYYINNTALTDNDIALNIPQNSSFIRLNLPGLELSDIGWNVTIDHPHMNHMVRVQPRVVMVNGSPRATPQISGQGAFDIGANSIAKFTYTGLDRFRVEILQSPAQLEFLHIASTASTVSFAANQTTLMGIQLAPFTDPTTLSETAINNGFAFSNTITGARATLTRFGAIDRRFEVEISFNMSGAQETFEFNIMKNTTTNVGATRAMRNLGQNRVSGAELAGVTTLSNDDFIRFTVRRRTGVFGNSGNASTLTITNVRLHVREIV